MGRDSGRYLPGGKLCGAVDTDCRNGTECTAWISQETEGRGRRNGVGEKRAGGCCCGTDFMEESPLGRCGITGDGCSDDLYLRNAGQCCDPGACGGYHGYRSVAETVLSAQRIAGRSTV